MKRLFLAFAVAVVATTAQAAPLLFDVSQTAAGVATFDPNLFAPGPDVDVYSVSVINPNADPATSLELSLPGNFVNNNAGQALTFKDSPELPTLGPNTVGESFFVLPAGTSDLAVDVVDDASRLQAAYTVEGDTALIPGSGSALVATLSVPAGEPLDISGFTGAAAVNGEFLPIIIPEPTTALLAGLALAGFVARRK